MLVEVLAGTQAERESVIAHQPDGGRHLRDDCRMVTNRRAGDHGHELHPTRLTRHGAKHAPSEGALALLFEPRMEVIGDDGEIETGALALRCRYGPVPWDRVVRTSACNQKLPSADLAH
jgi:hypothetical protein